MQSRAARLARGWVTGAFATVVAAVLHVSAGGIAPSALAIGLALVFAGLLGTALTGRRPSLPRLAVAVGLSQAAFHLGFSVIGAGGGVAATASGHHAAFAFTAGEGMSHAAHQDGPLMWVAHVAAGALTIAFLVGAERALWRMLSSAARFVATAFRSPSVVPLPRAVRASIVSARPRRAAGALLATTLSRRGPPAFGIS
jgi:hypothetical protein